MSTITDISGIAGFQPGSRQPSRAASTPTLAEVEAVYRRPLLDLIEQAHAIHREFHPEGEVQLCQLLSIKTGGCPEDCAYCPQSAHYQTGVKAEALLDAATVLDEARRARQEGATRFCMGAAWRQAKAGADFERVLEIVRGVAGLGLEVCCTLGMLNPEQARRLAEAGLTAYNHNLDTSPEFYDRIISTRQYEDRLATLAHVRDAGLQVCCGGILGLGESESDRIRLLQVLASLPAPPESVPINALVPVAGTPLERQPPVEPLEMVRMIAAARILMPRSKVRLSAGRLELTDEAQTLCFYAGANSIFMGEKLLTTPNPVPDRDLDLLRRLGLRPEPPHRHGEPPRSAAAPAPGTGSAITAAEAEMEAELARLEAQSRRRRLAPAAGEDFCSNDYLGLADHAGIRQRMLAALGPGARLGSGGSRLVRGNAAEFERLEARMAAFCGAEAALLFPSGYAANIGLLSAIARPGDVFFSDALNHASLIDGMRLSGAERRVFPHLDLHALESLLRRPVPAGGRRWIVVESLYSMEGDRAPLAALAKLARQHGAALIVDEAHATGILGGNGEGGVAEAGIAEAVLARVHPCGKAVGAAGAFVCGSRTLCEWLVNRARPFIYTTAPPPWLAVQLDAALDVIQNEPWRRQRVKALAAELRAALHQSGCRLADDHSPGRDPESPIVAVLFGPDQAAVAAERQLAAAGFDCRAIRPPTVPEGSARLRLSVHATHTPAMLARLADELRRCLPLPPSHHPPS